MRSEKRNQDCRRNIESFAAQHRSVINFMPVESRVYFVTRSDGCGEQCLTSTYIPLGACRDRLAAIAHHSPRLMFGLSEFVKSEIMSVEPARLRSNWLPTTQSSQSRIPESGTGIFGAEAARRFCHLPCVVR